MDNAPSTAPPAGNSNNAIIDAFRQGASHPLILPLATSRHGHFRAGGLTCSCSELEKHLKKSDYKLIISESPENAEFDSQSIRSTFTLPVLPAAY